MNAERKVILMIEQKENPFQLDVVSIRMVKDAPFYSKEAIDHPRKVVELLAKELCDMDREVMYVINVNTKSVPINCSLVSIGTLNRSLTSPREILKSAILSNAAGIILLHNHPSGDTTPSEPDISITKRMGMACDVVGVDLLDHIIVGTDGISYFSFCENQILPEMKENKKEEQALNAAAERRGIR